MISPVKTTDNLNEHTKAERVLGSIRAGGVIMAGEGREAMHCGEAEITNWYLR
jgi:hypothetical protein